MAGFAIGPVLFGPLSEYFGRKPVLVITIAIYLIFTMACAVSPTFPALLAFQFFCGLGGSAPNAILGGLFSDIYDDPHQRGLAMSWFMFATTFPPLLGPIISGFISEITWRWTFWAGLIIGAPGFPLLLTMPETYVPVLRQRHEKSHNEKQTTEKSLYGLSAGVVGLAFLPILPGSIIAFIIVFMYSSYYSKALRAELSWAKLEEYRRLPLACIGAPGIPIALFWLGWSAKLSMHPVMPMMSGIFFGFGYLLIFVALLNYLTDAYKQFSASASAATSTLRSIFAVFLPLATTPMYNKLGINWASSLLGLFSLAMAIVPFVFIRNGVWIRANSKFVQKAQ
ncbi:hypothetical protein PENANT_c147G05018 [Penicillium antarcticum]|uniref:Major facilitator superfamily (MFS) profile domain-containing protein n=1 Tax=Penicillium antarcticum TaxID=416450 RepID=A0A1V6PEZ9_9EURO|nr:hypothetical protein PENANT_c147G05018 [Penicillium antarcticum]